MKIAFVLLTGAVWACGGNPYESQPEKFAGTWEGLTADFRVEFRLAAAVCDYRLACFGHGSGTWTYVVGGEEGTGVVDYFTVDPGAVTPDHVEIVIILGDQPNNACFEYRARFADGKTLRGMLRQLCVTQKQPSDPPLAVKTFEATIDLLRR